MEDCAQATASGISMAKDPLSAISCQTCRARSFVAHFPTLQEHHVTLLYLGGGKDEEVAVRLVKRFASKAASTPAGIVQAFSHDLIACLFDNSELSEASSCFSVLIQEPEA